MELWIRTQSKQSLVKVDNVSITEQTKTRYNIDSGECILGRYNSFERALEVLDEIQRKLDYIYDSSLRPRVFTTVEHKIVYEMPKE